MNFYSAENKLFLKLSHLNKHLPRRTKYILYTSRISLWWKLCHCHQFSTDKALRNRRLVKLSYYTEHLRRWANSGVITSSKTEHSEHICRQAGTSYMPAEHTFILLPVSHHVHCTPAQCVKYLQEPSHCRPFHIICAAHLHSVLNICRNQQLQIYIIYSSHAVEWTGEGRNKRGQFYGRRRFQDIACPDAFGGDGAKREDLLCTHTRWHSRPCRCATPRYPIYSWNKHTETWLLPSHYVKDTVMAH